MKEIEQIPDLILKGKKMAMNKKQKLTLLGGAAVAVLGAINALVDFYHPGFDIYLVTVALITVFCFYNFKDKQNENSKNIFPRMILLTYSLHNFYNGHFSIDLFQSDIRNP